MLSSGRLLLCAVLTLAVAFPLARPLDAAEPPKPEKHTLINLEGWSVHVDARLTDGPDAELGKRAVKLLGNQLCRIALITPADRLQKLREVPI